MRLMPNSLKPFLREELLYKANKKIKMLLPLAQLPDNLSFFAPHHSNKLHTLLSSVFPSLPLVLQLLSNDPADSSNQLRIFDTLRSIMMPNCEGDEAIALSVRSPDSLEELPLFMLLS